MREWAEHDCACVVLTTADILCPSLTWARPNILAPPPPPPPRLNRERDLQVELLRVSSSLTATTINT